MSTTFRCHIVASPAKNTSVVILMTFRRNVDESSTTIRRHSLEISSTSRHHFIEIVDEVSTQSGGSARALRRLSTRSLGSSFGAPCVEASRRASEFPSIFFAYRPWFGALLFAFVETFGFSLSELRVCVFTYIHIHIHTDVHMYTHIRIYTYSHLHADLDVYASSRIVRCGDCQLFSENSHLKIASSEKPPLKIASAKRLPALRTASSENCL